MIETAIVAVVPDAEELDWVFFIIAAVVFVALQIGFAVYIHRMMGSEMDKCRPRQVATRSIVGASKESVQRSELEDDKLVMVDGKWVY